jgi:apolipoprotein N-acyltransferase
MLYFALFAPVLLILSRSPGYIRPFLLAAAWTLYEYFRSLGFLGFPWNMAAHPFGGILPLAQTAALSGMWPITFISALFCALTAELPYIRDALSGQTFFRSVSAASAMLLVLLLSGSFLLSAQRKRVEGMEKVPMLLIQTNVDFWREGEAVRGIAHGQALSRAGLEAHPETRLVVWSENSLQYPYEGSASMYRNIPAGDPFIGFLKEIDTPLLTGVPHYIDYEKGEAMNSAVIIQPDGTTGPRYGKSHLVPFAERVPFWNFAPLRGFLQNFVGLQTAGWTPGDISALLRIESENGKSIDLGTPICFEDSFPYITRFQAGIGAQLFINLTNDSWSKTIAGETQHFAAARYRAAETGRSLVRSTNAGVTSLILPTGEVTDHLPLYEAGFLAVSVPVSDPGYKTFYMLAGDWFAQLLLLVLVHWRIAALQKKRSGHLVAERFFGQ